MKIKNPLSHIYSKSSSVVLLTTITVIGFISLVIFISYTYNAVLDQLESVLSEEEVESEKMQINSELMELARSRTRITSEILETDDHFKKDELALELDALANDFSRLRNKLLNLPLTDEEKQVLHSNDVIVSNILPVQRSAVELAMSGLQEKELEARDLLYNTVLPGQSKLIDSFRLLVSIEQDKIAELTAKSNLALRSIKKRNQIIASTVIVIATLLSAVVVIRIRRIQLELRVYSQTLSRINEDLEMQVAERTKELSELNSYLKKTSERDELTGLYNRRKFNTFLENELARANREGSFFSLIIIDIDYFKPFNDNYGHLKGDEVLSSVAGIMEDALPRSIDFIARYGGEEFVVVLPLTEEKGAIKVANILREKVVAASIPHEYSKVGSCVTISQGITTYHAKDEISLKEIVNKADEALYLAKANGRNRVELLDNH